MCLRVPAFFLNFKLRGDFSKIVEGNGNGKRTQEEVMNLDKGRIYLSDGGFPGNIDKLVGEGYNLETLFFAMSDVLTGNLDLHVRDFRETIQLLGVRKLSLHGPFFDLSLASRDKEIVDLTMKRYKQAISIAGRLNVNKIIFHSQYNTQLRFQAYIDEWLKTSSRYFKKLIESTRGENFTILIENMFDDDLGLIKRLIDEVDSPRMGICLDVAHVHVYSNTSIIEWIKRLSPYIKHLHFSDNNGDIDSHLPLGRGSIDFPGIFRALSDNGIEPDICIELNTEEKYRESLAYLEKIL